MSVLIVGSTALDSIKTPTRDNPRLLGGSASHAAVAASFFSPVKLIGVVGEDFPKKYIQLYQRHKIDLSGLQILPGKTFHWSGEYEVNMNNRRTLATELGVFETFNPTLPKVHQQTQFVLLANIAPALQHHVLDQMRKPKFVVADTMDLWLNLALKDLLKLFERPRYWSARKPTAGKGNCNGQTNNDASVLSVTPLDPLLYEARLNDGFLKRVISSPAPSVERRIPAGCPGNRLASHHPEPWRDDSVEHHP